MNVNNINTEWFAEWFDSPYYHILYKNRDDKEAKSFITNLITFLKPKKHNSFVDVACGKGRHAMFLNSLGYNVDGFDLSENSISTAKLKENDTLRFYTNDIRIPLKKYHYDFAFNLFTSFGYFDDENDNQKAINAIAETLTEKGVIVLDFMNCTKVITNLNKQETKVIDGIEFHINRNFVDGYIVKDINFEADNNQYNFQEKVKAISLETFQGYFLKANLNIESVFGDYDLNPFNIDSSDRLILVAKKK